MTTRFAPSLTGYLHLGHVLHMLYVWGIARSKKAQIICRMEDHDQGRARPEYEAAILSAMDRLGFIPDLGMGVQRAGGPSDFRQSDNALHYAGVLETLNKQGLVYGCECSRRQVAAKQSAGAGELCYPGTCAEKGLPLEGNTVRFRVPDRAVTFQDIKRGECRQVPRIQCGDFSLRDRTGQWTYQFCCVCDDIRQGVDLVIRGEDLLFSTARQIQLFQALGKPIPQFYHHPLLLDERGNKLSKRQYSQSISQWYEAGKSTNDIFGCALNAAGHIPRPRPVSLPEALDIITSE